MPPHPALGKAVIDHHIGTTLQWLSASMEATGGKGSAGYYHLWKGWSEAYPETTGYLIETLFDAYHLTQIESIKISAVQCADWLCSLQMPDGAFPGGIGGKMPPLIFDTAMVLSGLRRAFEETKEEKYFTATKQANKWLESTLEVDGIWRKHAYVEGFSPAYYSMVVWSMLQVNKHLKEASLGQRLNLALEVLEKKITPQLSIEDWGFKPGKAAYTHTIAYTLQGMLEAALLLKNKQLALKVQSIAGKILELRQIKGKLPGTFDGQWKGDYSFGCLTGQAQMSLLYFRLFEIYGNIEFLAEGRLLLWQMLRFQSNVHLNGWLGGIPGSAPIWARYQRFRFINWGAKYFLDALIMARKLAK